MLWRPACPCAKSIANGERGLPWFAVRLSGRMGTFGLAHRPLPVLYACTRRCLNPSLPARLVARRSPRSLLPFLALQPPPQRVAMQFTSESVEALVEHLTKLPTIGRKTAQRLANYVLKMPAAEVEAIAQAFLNVKEQVQRCSQCYVVADHDPCPICRSEKRDATTVCVVEESSDVLAVERTGDYRGRYHVLGGVISPLDGVGPDDLRIRELAQRIDPAFSETSAGGSSGDRDAPGGRDASANGAAQDVAQDDPAAPGADAEDEEDNGKPLIREVILAVNPNVEGDTTAYYISQLLQPFDVTVTRIARGLPIGGDLEYADEATLSRALQGRGAV